MNVKDHHRATLIFAELYNEYDSFANALSKAGKIPVETRENFVAAKMGALENKISVTVQGYKNLDKSAQVGAFWDSYDDKSSQETEDMLVNFIVIGFIESVYVVQKIVGRPEFSCRIPDKYWSDYIFVSDQAISQAVMRPDNKAVFDRVRKRLVEKKHDFSHLKEILSDISTKMSLDDIRTLHDKLFYYSGLPIQTYMVALLFDELNLEYPNDILEKYPIMYCWVVGRSKMAINSVYESYPDFPLSRVDIGGMVRDYLTGENTVRSGKVSYSDIPTGMDVDMRVRRSPIKRVVRRSKNRRVVRNSPSGRKRSVKKVLKRSTTLHVRGGALRRSK